MIWLSVNRDVFRRNLLEKRYEKIPLLTTPIFRGGITRRHLAHEIPPEYHWPLKTLRAVHRGDRHDIGPFPVQPLQAGIWLAFHNEPDHQRKVEGEIPLDVFLARTEPKFVRFQLDVGNMLMGGGDPMVYLNRYKDRIGSFHLKNVVADRKADTELGAGVFDLRAFLAAVPDLAKKPCFVEQEGAADELASAKTNFEYVRGLSW